MKTQTTKPTQEEKAAYIASYYGQKVLTDGVQIHKISNVFNLKHEDFYLSLNHISSITDEEAIKVARIMRPSTFELYPHDWRVNRTDKEIEITHKNCIYEFDIDFSGSLGVDNGQYWEYLWNAEMLYAYDYLRSKGYALPWRGYTVSQLQDFGWLKLRQKGGEKDGR